MERAARKNTNRRRPTSLVERHSPLRFEWPDRLIRLMGKVPDPELAKEAGLSIDTVAKERHRRGIPAFQFKRPAVKWTPQMDKLLGTDSDRTVAAMLGIGRGSVMWRRACLCMPPYQPPPHPASRRDWIPSEIALLGTVPDRAVADALGTSVGCVARKRRELRIPPFKPKPPRVRWTRKMLALLATMPDTELAARLGIAVSAVSRKRQALGMAPYVDKRAVRRKPALLRLLHLPSTVARARTGLRFDTIAKLRKEYGIRAPTFYQARWAPEVIARLGKVPDREIARELRISTNRVSSKRRSLGIPAPERTWRRWTPDELLLLGKLPDHEVARRTGHTLASVGVTRRELARRARLEQTANQGAEERPGRGRPRARPPTTKSR
jgi:hypothetical protein